MQIPSSGNDWVGLSRDVLPVEQALEWAHRPDCGAVVLFSGVARDHSSDRTGVDQLEYEAYESQVEPRLAELAAEARTRWPAVGRLVMMHRIGELVVGDSAVIVVASSPHRPEAFAAARFCIDALKATIPIWKRERWDDGESWGLEAQHIVEVDDLRNATVRGDGSVTLSDAPFLGPVSTRCLLCSSSQFRSSCLLLDRRCSFSAAVSAAAMPGSAKRRMTYAPSRLCCVINANQVGR